MSIDEKKYSDLYSNFDGQSVDPYKSRRQLIENLNSRIEYKEKLVETYNDIINSFIPIIPTLSLEEKFKAQLRVNAILKKLKECFGILRLNLILSA